MGKKIVKCPKCHCDHLHHKSIELVEYCTKACETVKIYWNNAFRTYECQGCGYSFNSLDKTHKKLGEVISKQ